MRVLLPLCVLMSGCTAATASVDSNPDVSPDYKLSKDPVKRKAAMEKAQKAAKDLDAALKQSPNNQSILDKHAYAHLKLAYQYTDSSDNAPILAHMDAALADYLVEQKAHPNSALFAYRIGSVSLLAGRCVEEAGDIKDSKRRFAIAVENFQKCLSGKAEASKVTSADPFFQIRTKTGLANAYLALGEPDEALKALRGVSAKRLPKDLQGKIELCQKRAREKLSDRH